MRLAVRLDLWRGPDLLQVTDVLRGGRPVARPDLEAPVRGHADRGFSFWGRAMSDLPTLLRSLRPVLNPGVFAFCVLPPGVEVDAVVTVREPEGVTAVVPEEVAAAHGLTPAFRAGWITLGVQSDLAAVGLTAAVAAALAAEGIACNVVAGVYHDHLFVPADRGGDAIAALQRLAASHAAG